jgi:hypothetical protein
VLRRRAGGTSQASAFSALIAGRQTKAAQAVMRRYGLLGEDGRVIAEARTVAKRTLKRWFGGIMRRHLSISC